MGPSWIYDGGAAPAGTETILGTVPRKPKAGGSVLFGTLTDPVVAGFRSSGGVDTAARTFAVAAAEVLGSVLRDPDPGDAGALGVIGQPLVVGFENAAAARTTARTYDTDSGGGTENTLGVNLRKSAGGGSVEFGTPADPIFVAQGTAAALAGRWPIGLAGLDSGGGGPHEATITPVGPNNALDVNIVGAIVLIAKPNDAFDAAFPATGFGAGFVYDPPPFGAVDSGDMAPARVYGGNTDDPGYETILGTIPRKPKAGGAGVDASVLFGTLTDPVVAGFRSSGGVDTAARTFAVAAAEVLGSVLRDPDPGDAGALGVIGQPLVVGFENAAAARTTARTYDTDSAGGIENTLGVNLRKSAGGGSVEFGTPADPIFVAQGTAAALAGRWPIGLAGLDSGGGGPHEATITPIGPNNALDVNIVGAIVLIAKPADAFDAAFPATGFGAGFVYDPPPFGAVDSGDMAPARVYGGNTDDPGYETILGTIPRKPKAGGAGVDASVLFGTLTDPVVAGFDNGAGGDVPARTYDTDSGGGTENTLGVSLRKTAGGGSVELGTVADPMVVQQGTAAALAGRWPIGIAGLDSGGGGPHEATITPLGPNNALDVNIVNTIAVGSPFGAAFPATGVATGWRDPVSGFMEHATVTVGPSGTIPAGRQAVDVNVLSFTGTITGADETRPIAGAHTVIPVSIVAVNLLPALPLPGTRRQIIFENRSTSRTLFLLFESASTLSVTSSLYSVKIDPGERYEVPFPVFNGSIDGVWSAGTPGGDAQMTVLS
jgi:hypothetical protein